MKDTILSLNESNKIQKHYLAGTYGQGGSSTLAFSQSVFIAPAFPEAMKSPSPSFGTRSCRSRSTRRDDTSTWLRTEQVLTVKAKETDFLQGTLIRHFGYDLTSYVASIGPKSLYGALQRLFSIPSHLSVLKTKSQAGTERSKVLATHSMVRSIRVIVPRGDRPRLSNPDVQCLSRRLRDSGLSIGFCLAPRSRTGKDLAGKPSRAFVDDTKPATPNSQWSKPRRAQRQIIKKESTFPSFRRKDADRAYQLRPALSGGKAPSLLIHSRTGPRGLPTEHHSRGGH